MTEAMLRPPFMEADWPTKIEYMNENENFYHSDGLEVVELAKGGQNGVGKCLRYCMSTPRGKVEIVGKLPEGKMLFKFNQAKNAADAGRIFVETVQPEQCWLDLPCE